MRRPITRPEPGAAPRKPVIVINSPGGAQARGDRFAPNRDGKAPVRRDDAFSRQGGFRQDSRQSDTRGRDGAASSQNASRGHGFENRNGGARNPEARNGAPARNASPERNGAPARNPAPARNQGAPRQDRFAAPAPRFEDEDSQRSARPPSVPPHAPLETTLSTAEIAASPFTELGLVPALVRAVLEAGYRTPTPIQTETIPLVLTGRDLLGRAQTGTGKTASFFLPLLQRLGARGASGKVRALVLSPTRELAAQLATAATNYGKYWGLSHTVIYGGVNQRSQERALSRRPDILVATPGRLLDLMNQRLIDLRAVEILVLDEADTMLDMGFIHDVRRIVSQVPAQRQTLLFSATMPGAIQELANSIQRDPLRVAVAPQVTTAETVDQAVYFVSKPDKRSLLQQVLSTPDVERALVFTRTKRGADRVAQALVQGGVEAAAIHGNKSQNARDRALDAFRKGRTMVLVATDIAARGIDVPGVSHVINYDLPNVAESYVHRIGRTGRAGATGRAISFCDREERPLLTDIERLIRRRLPVANATDKN